jgi:hypothetical protein
MPIGIRHNGKRWLMPTDTASLNCSPDPTWPATRILLSPSQCRHLRSSPGRPLLPWSNIGAEVQDPGPKLPAAIEKFPRPTYSNCLIFAIRLWLTRGGYLIVRKSRAGWFPHFLWCSNLVDAKVVHFAPQKIAPWWYRPIHMLWFHNVVKYDDL